MSRTRSVIERVIVALALGGGAARQAHAQCVANLVDELNALDAAVSAVATATFNSAGAAAAKTPWVRFNDALQDDGAFFMAAARAGLAAPCLVERRAEFRNAARASLLKAIPDSNLTNRQAEVRAALLGGAATALQARYAPSDRIGILFGFGASIIHHRDDAARYKVITQRGVAPDTASQQYIVEETDSRTLPIATTGVAVRFRDRTPPELSNCGRKSRGSRLLRSCGYWVLDHVWPTTIFGALQFGGGEGTVSGTTLGVGWRVVGDITLLAGYGISRLPALREDIERQFVADASGRMRLPTGESAETIMGTQSQETWTITLGIPLALKNAFGTK